MCDSTVLFTEQKQGTLESSPSTLHRSVVLRVLMHASRGPRPSRCARILLKMPLPLFRCSGFARKQQLAPNFVQVAGRLNWIE
jgi:hypothetical protein